MSEVFFEAYEDGIIRRLGGTAFSGTNDQVAFSFKKYGLKITVTKEGLGMYFCEVTKQDIPVPTCVVVNGSDILYVISKAMNETQRAMRPFIMMDAAAKFLEDEIKKEFHYDSED